MERVAASPQPARTDEHINLFIRGLAFPFRSRARPGPKLPEKALN